MAHSPPSGAKEKGKLSSRLVAIFARSTPAPPFNKDDYVKLGVLDSMAPNVPQRIKLPSGEPVAVVRLKDGRVVAIGDECCHKRASLCEGDIEDLGASVSCAIGDGTEIGGACIRCPLHRTYFNGGLYYNLFTGQAHVRTPSSHFHPLWRQPVYDVHLEGKKNAVVYVAKQARTKGVRARVDDGKSSQWELTARTRVNHDSYRLDFTRAPQSKSVQIAWDVWHLGLTFRLPDTSTTALSTSTTATTTSGATATQASSTTASPAPVSNSSSPVSASEIPNENKVSPPAHPTTTSSTELQPTATTTSSTEPQPTAPAQQLVAVSSPPSAEPQPESIPPQQSPVAVSSQTELAAPEQSSVEASIPSLAAPQAEPASSIAPQSEAKDTPSQSGDSTQPAQAAQSQSSANDSPSPAPTKSEEQSAGHDATSVPQAVPQSSTQTPAASTEPRPELSEAKAVAKSADHKQSPSAEQKQGETAATRVASTSLATRVASTSSATPKHSPTSSAELPPSEPPTPSAAEDNRFLTRDYTPITSKADFLAGRVSLLIKIYPNGRLTPHLENLPLKSHVIFQEPQPTLLFSNLFRELASSSSSSSSSPNPFSMYMGIVVGGTGITPVFQLVSAALTAFPQVRFRLLCVNRSKEDILMFAELAELQRAHAQQFQVSHTLTRGGSDWEGSKGRPTSEHVTWLFGGHAATSSASSQRVVKAHKKAVVCGPVGLMKAAATLLEQAGLSPNEIVCLDA